MTAGNARCSNVETRCRRATQVTLSLARWKYAIVYAGATRGRAAKPRTAPREDMPVVYKRGASLKRTTPCFFAKRHGPLLTEARDSMKRSGDIC